MSTVMVAGNETTLGDATRRMEEEEKSRASRKKNRCRKSGA
jgi:hypothetical protein